MASDSDIKHTAFRATISVLVAGLLTSGCSGYFSEDWPKLTAPATDIRQPVQITMSFTPPPAIYRQSRSDMQDNQPETARDRFAALQQNFLELTRNISSQRQRYEQALSEIASASPGEDRKQHWVTGQLELTRLSQISNGYDDILAGLDGLPSTENIRTLWDKTLRKEQDMDRYLKSERLQLGSRQNRE